MVQSIHARFRLDQVNRSRGYYKEPGAEKDKSVEAAYVTLGGVMGEPFGSATPSAKLEMLIVNPDAARLFFHAVIGQEFDVLITPHGAIEHPLFSGPEHKKISLDE